MNLLKKSMLMRYRIPRLPADIALSVEYSGRVCAVRLVNISTTGARLEGFDPPLPRDAKVTLQYLHMRVSAQVIWSYNGQTGVHFVTPLSQSTVDALRGAGGSMSSTWGSFGHRYRELS